MGHEKKQFAWWYYFWLLAALAVIAPFYAMGDLVDFALWAFDALGLVGLWAYLRRRPIVSRYLWRLYLVGMGVFLVYSSTMLLSGEHAAQLGDGTWQSILIGIWFLTVLISAPLFVALWRYSFRSNEIWLRSSGAA